MIELISTQDLIKWPTPSLSMSRVEKCVSIQHGETTVLKPHDGCTTKHCE